jgi:hypothetical protein
MHYIMKVITFFFLTLSLIKNVFSIERSDIISFMVNGWIKLEGLLPELLDTSLRKDIIDTSNALEMRYIGYILCNVST